MSDLMNDYLAQKSRAASTGFADIVELDHNVTIDLASMRQKLTVKERKELHEYLIRLVKGADKVEDTLTSAWGISPLHKKIIIYASGPFNIGSAGDEIQIFVGKPSEYAIFFLSPIALYAHELGHILSSYDEKGEARVPFEAPLVERMNTYHAKLNEKGALAGKYLEDIPFYLLPSKIFFSEGADRKCAPFIMANEMIATKVALQLSGKDEARKFARSLIETEKNAKNPYKLLYFLVLAKELGLHSKEPELYARILQGDCPWKDTISTDELISSMMKFFENVSLKHQ